MENATNKLLIIIFLLSLTLLTAPVDGTTSSSQEQQQQHCTSKNDINCKRSNNKNLYADDDDVDFEDDEENEKEEEKEHRRDIEDHVQDNGVMEPVKVEEELVEMPVVSDDRGCVHFDASRFTSEMPSIMVIEAKGRLGNHMIAFTLIQALKKVLKVTGT